jgi:glycosyltransferase involved in cell wall biosynthesis
VSDVIDDRIAADNHGSQARDARKRVIDAPAQVRREKVGATGMEPIDVIVPCYNAAETLKACLDSALSQAALGRIWLIDDGSTDASLQIARAVAAQAPERIEIVRQPVNGGAASARNEGARRSRASVVAFLDADDRYEPEALHAPYVVFAQTKNLALLRLPMRAVGLPERYAAHPGFAKAWEVMQMTSASNMVIRRDVLLACGGFPEHPLFRRLGGEDAALGNAIMHVCRIGTLFEHAGVLYRYRPGARCSKSRPSRSP